MKLEKEDVVKVEQNTTGNTPTPNAIRPHFVYHGMRYFVTEFETNETDLKQFDNVGKAKSLVYFASKYFSSNYCVGDLLYASDKQNRYMVAIIMADKKYYYYENQAYFKDECINEKGVVFLGLVMIS